MSAVINFDWCEDISLELVGGKKSSADDSHVVNQDLVLFWESEPFIRLEKKPLCFQWSRLHISLSTPARPVQPWERTSGGPVRPWSPPRLGYTSSNPEQNLWYLEASVMLFSCSGREWNSLQYGERSRKKQLCKHGFQQVCSRWGVSVRTSVEQWKRLSLCYLMLAAWLMCCSRLLI